MSGSRIRKGLSSLTANSSSNNYTNPQGYRVGKVYAVMLNDKSVPKKVWDNNGGWSGVGTVLYQEYKENNEISLEDINDELISSLPTALPLFPNQKYFPLPGEIVLLMDLPSAPSPITGKAEETYYVSTINAWNSSQFNGLFLDDNKNLLYDSFKEDPDFRGIRAFEGDYILEGRFGNSIRMGSTNKSGNVDLNPWSSNPEEIDSNPITIISNKHNNKAENSDLFVEDINKDGSSIYLTSKQTISLDIGNVKLSNITSPISLKEYNNNQIIMNSDRVIINSKKDEVFLMGKTGVELISNGHIYIQGGKTGLTIQDNSIFLGPSDNSQETQPLVLGGELKIFLSEIVKSLSDFSSALTQVMSTPEGTPLMELNSAATILQGSIKQYITKLDSPDFLLSKQVYTI